MRKFLKFPLTFLAAFGSFAYGEGVEENLTACSKGFNPQSYLAKDYDLLYQEKCVSRGDSWAVNPISEHVNVPRYDISSLEDRNHSYFVLSVWTFKGQQKISAPIADILKLEKARAGEQYGSIGTLGCWEKGRDIYPNENSTIALGLVKVDKANKRTELLKMWRVNKSTKKLYQADIERAKCDPSAFEKSYRMLEQLKHTDKWKK